MLSKNITLIITGLFAFSMPLSTKVANYLLLVLLIFLVGKEVSDKGIKQVYKNFEYKELFRSTFVLYLLIILGLFYTTQLSLGLYLLKHYIFYFLIPIVFILLDTSALKNIKNTSSKWFVLGATLSSSILLINNFIKFFLINEKDILWFNLFNYEYTYHEFTSLLNFHPTFLGIYIVFAFVLVNECKEMFTKNISFIVKTLLLLCLVFLNSRSSYLLFFTYAMYCFYGFYKIVFINKKKKKFFLISILAIFSAISIFIYIMKDTYIYDRIVRQVEWELTQNKGTSYDGVYSNDSRMSRWKALLDVAAEKPLLGYGSGSQSEVVLIAYEKHGLEYAYKFKYDPHNYYIFVLIEHGIIGVLIYLILFMFNMIYFIVKRNVLAIILVFILLITSLFDSILYITPAIIFFTFFINLFYFLNRKEIIIN